MGQYGKSIFIDTLCFTEDEIRRLLIAAEQGKLYKEQVKILEERIANLEAQVKVLADKDEATVASYEKQISVMLEQRDIFEKIIRKERRKNFWTKVGGGLTTGILAYLLIIKK